jgi:hypothetical protein
LFDEIPSIKVVASFISSNKLKAKELLSPFQLVSATVSDFIYSNNKAVLTKKLMMLWV